MFGIKPNIHMHQMPENIREQNPNRRLIGSGDFLDSKDESNKVSSETEQESHSTIFGFFHGSEEETPSDEDKTETPAQPEEKVSDKPAEQAAGMNENKPEEKPEEKPQRPVFDFTDEAEDEKKAEDKPEEKPEEKPQRPIFDFTDEAEDEKQAEDKPEEKPEEKPQRPIFDFTDEAEEDKTETEEKPNVSEDKPSEDEVKIKDKPEAEEKANQIATVQNPWKQQMPQYLQCVLLLFQDNHGAWYRSPPQRTRFHPAS